MPRATKVPIEKSTCSITLAIVLVVLVQPFNSVNGAHILSHSDDEKSAVNDVNYSFSEGSSHKHLLLVTNSSLTQIESSDELLVKLVSSAEECWKQTETVYDGMARIVDRNDTHLVAAVNFFNHQQKWPTLSEGFLNGNSYINHQPPIIGVCACLSVNAKEESDLFYLPFSTELSSEGGQKDRRVQRSTNTVDDAGKFEGGRGMNSVNDAGKPEGGRSDLVSGRNLVIFGLRVEHADKEPTVDEEAVPSVLSHSSVTLRLFGMGLSEDTVVVFTQEHNIFGGSCLVPVTNMFQVIKGSVSGYSATVRIELPATKTGTYFYLCAKHGNLKGTEQSARSVDPFIHQGSDAWMRMTSYEPLLPLWVSLLIIGICLMFSALFSGLNLGLMSLDRTDLKILCNTGTEEEKQYARAIQPVRDHGNFLLCSILLGNVLVNSTFTILLDGLTSGLVAVICSTIAIVIFGEITPQAICSRHGLAVGAKTILITKTVMLITAPLAYPTSKILDYLLGEEIGNFYNRERLKELVKVTNDINDLDKDEVNVISGVLELRKKTAEDVMTRIDDAFMLPLDAVLDFETITEIMKSGFSRIPVYENERNNIITLLYIKDLAFVDPDDNTQLKTLCEFYQNPCHFVFEDITLDLLFKQFKEGHKGHMAFVHRVNNEGEGDPFYETVGLVTLEDVIEELIQAEIMDETDVFTDNRRKVRRDRIKCQDFAVFSQGRDGTSQRLRISPQLTLATFQYLSTSVDAFKADVVSETILRRLLNQDIVHHVKHKGKDKNDPSMFIISRGKPADFFVLILEGRVEVTVGRENLVFESGPFTYFGTQALIQNVGVDIPTDSSQQIMGSLQSLNMDAMLRHTFLPDYTVKAVTEVVYIQIKRNLYLAAKRATLMERSQRVGEHSLEPFDDEVEKLLHSLDEDDRSVGADTTNLQTPKASKPTSNAPSPTTIVSERPTPDQNNGPISSTVPLNLNVLSMRSNSLAVTSQRTLDESEKPLLTRSKS
ncbi:unextended protein [Malaya genurostris]|uniref:unextended protein n=1 Tax=Malaya genurostris TaxID=325434 RepID=UPI0026F40520|nr:unextended protein [Malaya genurostris]